MILREATDKDLPQLATFCDKVWKQLGIEATLPLSRFQDRKADRVRFFVLFEDDEMQAALGGSPFRSVDGDGYNIWLFTVNQKHRDRMKMLDAVVLYCCHIAISEGNTRIVSVRRPGQAGTLLYGDTVGMSSEPKPGDHIDRIGDAKAMMKAILDRRPEWQISP